MSMYNYYSSNYTNSSDGIKNVVVSKISSTICNNVIYKVTERPRLLIFGGTGSLGNHLVDTFIETMDIIIFSRDENKQWAMRSKYASPTDTSATHANNIPDPERTTTSSVRDASTVLTTPPNSGRGSISYILGCIRDKDAVTRAILSKQPTYIIIAAALKHIDQCENNISECISTNIIGTQNIVSTVCDAILNNRANFLTKVLFISTDKACSPVNAYGMSKALSERIMIEAAANTQNVSGAPSFLIVRYGNVINSRGSLFPVCKTIGMDDTRLAFNITDINMTRFFMTLDESIRLIKTALEFGKSGEIFIPKVYSYKIYDIIKLFSEKYNKPINIVGVRVGEKLHEELINITESYRTRNTDDIYIIAPCFRKPAGGNEIEIRNYTSNDEINDVSNLLKYI
jgi:UDP-N-acetylglucosamine 4,6-dehydratase